MRKLSFFVALMLLFAAAPVSAYQYKMTEYSPMSFDECMAKRRSLGMKFCWGDGDYLAGAAEACGGIKNLPTGKELLELAKSVYKIIETEPNGTTLYGKRDDKKMQELGIWVNDSHIFYWSNEEAHDVNGGYVRMFAVEGSIPYYAPRDGSGYVTHAVGHVNYGDTIMVKPVKITVEKKTEEEKKWEKKLNINNDEDNKDNEEINMNKDEDNEEINMNKNEDNEDNEEINMTENEDNKEDNDFRLVIEPDDERDSNLSGLPNNDALVTICIKRKK